MSSDERPRKRVRKGTKSCWECKRRKIRCQLSDTDNAPCAGCLSRGTTCRSQEYPEDREPSSNTQVGERLGRVEHLLETLIAKINAYEDDEKAQKEILTPESLTMSNEILTPHSSNAPANIENTTPFMSLFDNSVLGRVESNRSIPSQMPTPATMASSTRSASCCRPSKIDRVRQHLVDLLPSQKDADLVSSSNSCWLIVHATCVNPGF
jgi:hypothetical protein